MERLTLRNKIGYGLGDTANGMMFMMVSSFLLYFYTDVFGISAVAAGSLFMIARVWDAINDPIMGYIADRTNTRWGKFRPYLIWGAIPLTVLAVLMFSVPDLSSEQKVVYAYVTYILYGMAYTFVNIPYGSLSAAMTQDSHDRSTLAAFRTLGALIAASVAIIGTKPLVSLFPTEQIGFRNVMIIFSLVALVMYFICFRNTREQVVPVEEQNLNLKMGLKVILSNPPLMFLCLGTLCAITGGTIAQATWMYYAKYNLGDEGLFPKLMAMNVVAMIVGIILTIVIGKKLGKKTTYILGMVIVVLGNLGIFFISGSNIPMLFVFAAVVGVGSIIPNTLVWAMEADTVEYAEWKTGHRGTGVIYAAFSFVRKLAQALGGGLGGIILSYAGYIPNIVQSDGALFGIKAMITLIPIACSILAITFIAFYSLGEEKFQQIINDLEDRRKQQQIY